MLRDEFRVQRFEDRRLEPNHGYRAVHLIVEVENYPVEIQVRTALQHSWAEAFEKLADRLGRGIRYGDVPADPTAARRVAEMLRLSDIIYELERTGPEILPLGFLAGFEESDDPIAKLQRDYLARRETVRMLLQGMMMDSEGSE